MTDTTTITIDETETENYGLTDIPMAPCMNVEVIDRPRSYDVRPQYKTMGAAGMDLVADIEAPITIGPGETVTVGSGIKVALPNRYLVGLVFPKSGLGANEGLVLGNGVGVIDSDYRGEIKMAMTNRNHDRSVTIEPGQRVAQLLVLPVVLVSLNEVDKLDDTERGEGGFGSTGKF